MTVNRLLPSFIAAVPLVVLIFLLMYSLVSRPLPENQKPIEWKNIQFISLPAVSDTPETLQPAPLVPEPPLPEVQPQFMQPALAKPIISPKLPKLNLSSVPGNFSYLAQLSSFKPRPNIKPSTAAPAVNFRFKADQALVPLIRIEPRYPSRAAMKGIEGMVKLKLTILEDGTVSEVQIIEAKPRRIFNRAAIRAVKKWRFRPKKVNGAGVKQQAEQILNFRLDNKA